MYEQAVPRDWAANIIVVITVALRGRRTDRH